MALPGIDRCKLRPLYIASVAERLVLNSQSKREKGRRMWHAAWAQQDMAGMYVRRCELAPCRLEWNEWARQPDEAEDDYKGRVRKTFSFREQDVPALQRMPDHRGGGRASTPGKAGEACKPTLAPCMPLAACRLLCLCSSLPGDA